MKTPEAEPLSKAERKARWRRTNNHFRRHWEARHAEYHRELMEAKAAWITTGADFLAWTRIKDRLKIVQRDREAYWIGHEQLWREGKWQDPQAMREEAFKRGIQEIARRYCERLMRRGK